ncbi:MAG: asparaginase [Calditrichae bacterium]|nr:asparaginase [Calditrichota bacterium]MCB9057126.1 asparaginase [Calditrichia bacterium]
MKKILVIHTGGTFGMVPMEPDQVLAPGNLQDELLNHIPEVNQIAEIDVQIVCNEDSSNLGISAWNSLAEVIYSHMDKYDGFVIVHGTDTMVYSAAALSYSLINLQKPVIFTGAQLPLAKIRSDARLNFIDALEVATRQINEVLIVFGQRILRGNRSKKTSISNYGAYYSPNYPLIGEIGLNLEIENSLLLRPSGKFIYDPGFEPSLLNILIYPECDPVFYESIVENKALRAIQIIGFGAGNLPERNKEWIRFIRKCVDNKKAVFINSSSAHGKINLDIYESGHNVLKAGAVGCKNMTIEATTVKIMKALHKYSELQDIYSYTLSNIAGEIDL